MIFGGTDKVNRGSTTASCGMSTVPFSSIFTSFFVSLMMVNWVASDPVPAVVGMAVMGGVGAVMGRPM